MAHVVHQHGLWTAQSRLTKTFRRRRIPTIVASHGSLEPYARAQSAWKKRVAMAAFERDNLRNASCLHATAETEVRTLRDFGLRAPIVVLPNGVSQSWPQTTGRADRCRQRLGLVHGERLMLFLSRVHPIKGLPLLIEALSANRARLGDWRLVIAGPDERAHRAELEALVALRGLAGGVVFAGALFGEDKRDAFAAVELFVLPTYSENFGIVVAEALGSGVPVVTTHGAPWRDLEDHRCGWWVPTDSRTIGDALVDAAGRSRAELQAMGERGRQLVMSRYTWPAVAERALAVYRWLAKETPRPDFVIVE
jgi:glycosyltransferase involved in cell wall biosynthesis